jgi:hypothetical protein
MKATIFVLILLSFQPLAYGSLISYEGSFELDNTTSIGGTAKHDRFDFRLTLDGNSIDLDHGVDGKPDGATEFFGRYTGAVIGFQMTPDQSNTGVWDPSGLTYDLLGSSLLTWDVNPPAGSDPLDFMNEHLTVSIGVETAGSPLHRIYLNLYNSTFFPPDATRQLWLDASSPGNGFTLDDLFLHGMDTLPEFRSIKPWEGKSLVDSVYLDGGAGSPNFGTWGSGTINVAPIPVPAAAWLFGSALLGLGVVKRSKA